MSSSVSILNKRFMHKFVSLIVVLTMIGTSPGIFDALNSKVYAHNPFAEAEIRLPQQQQSELEDFEDESQYGEVSDDYAFEDEYDLEDESGLEDEEDIEDQVDREMSRAEQIAWQVGRALLPTLAVMAFSACVVLPLGWVVLGAIVVSAATAAVLSFAFEKRMNHFRDKDMQRPMDQIMREVTINAAVSGAMAPFTMLTAGFAQAVGPTTVRTIVTAAARMGVTSLAGGTISNVARGAVTNLWYHRYYKYGQEEKMLKRRINSLRAISERSPEEEQQLADALQRLQELENEKYTLDNFWQDQKKTLVSSAITGFLGGATGRFAAESDWAKIASSKLFGSTAHAGTLANAVVSNPFAFASGSANAGLDKAELLREIARARARQTDYEPGTAPYEYYQQRIDNLETAFENISIWRRGRDSMISNAAMQTAVVATSLARTRLIDLPAQKRRKVQALYEEQDELWQKAQEARKDLEIFRTKQPLQSDYESYSEYYSALRQYARDLHAMRDNYDVLKAQASAAQKSAANQAIIKDIGSRVDTQIEYARQEQLARALGRDSFIDFKADEIRSDPEFASLTEEQIRALAIKRVNDAFEASAQANAQRLAEMQRRLDNREDNLEGVLERGPDGRRVIAIKDSQGNTVATRPWEGGKGAHWFDRLRTSDVSELQEAEIQRAVEEVYNSASMIKPSTYRNSFVNMRVDQLRAQGLTEVEIEPYLSDIIREANADTLDTFGNSWQNVVKSEILAAGLERARYSDGEAPDIQRIVGFLRGELPNQTVSVFRNQLSAQVDTMIPRVEIMPIERALSHVDQQLLDHTAQRYLGGGQIYGR